MHMLETVLRNVLKRPATRRYPAEKREPFPDFRGRLVNNTEDCIFCRSCSNKCPAGAISTDPKRAYWSYDPFACVYCGVCVDACPTHSLFMLSSHRVPVPTKFMTYHKGTPRVARTKLKDLPSHGELGQPHAEKPSREHLPHVQKNDEEA